VSDVDVSDVHMSDTAGFVGLGRIVIKKLSTGFFASSMRHIV